MPEEISQVLNKCFSAKFRVTKSKEGNSKKVKMNKKIFTEVIDRLKEAADTSEDLLNMGVDLSLYEEPLLRAIESLLQLSFNKSQISLINIYLFEGSEYDQDEESYKVTITLPSGKKSEYNFDTVEDVWKVVQALKDVQD